MALTYLEDWNYELYTFQLTLDIPFILFVFFADNFEPFCWSCLNLDHAKTDSTIPVFIIALLNLSVIVHFEPNAFCCDVIVSLVWESNVGLFMRQFTNSHRWFLIWCGFIWTPLLFFFLIWSTKASLTNLETWSTCLPPNDKILC